MSHIPGTDEHKKVYAPRTRVCLCILFFFTCRYLFKRLRFLGNKTLSQTITLAYLSIWHGLHSGYHMNFFLEFLIMNGENQVR